MTAYRDALVIDEQASVERLALAAEILTSRKGVVMLDSVLALRSTHTRLLCEVVDPMPSAHRCAGEYEVLVENAQRALEASNLRDLLPGLPCEWLVVEDHGTGTAVVWHAP
jgi:hypothetical protein